MSQWDKLIAEILKHNKNLRFEDLAKALVKIGYKMIQSKKGTSHYKFEKCGKMPIIIPKQKPMNRAYIEMVRDAILEHMNESEDDA